ncbi:MAG TPA: UDP-N-acetylmuramate dehydrogenase [Draconibacterium sp.]|nr:UDP-N-acetylmuramate dehydrogenase [Draconibacterium sp.]
MIRFFENHSLKDYNTFGIDAKARYFFEFTEPEDLAVFLNENQSWKDERLIVIGQGSNILFLDDFDGLVIHPKVPGIKTVGEDRSFYRVEVGAGEVWDEFVEFCVTYNLGGVENLSLIPGMVGAAPVQNIGAYGQEVCNVVEKVKGYDLEKQEMAEFSADECRFAYRESIFKSYLKNRFIITSVVFRLDKFPEFNLKYGHLEEKVKEYGDVTLQNIRKAVIEIRNSKLPSVKDLGNAGSFFKNPLVEKELADRLNAEYENMPLYPAADQKAKLAAGWLIEQSGWKGKREGNVGVHKDQALVIVNYGGATGKEVWDFSEKIKEAVFEKFGVSLEREVNCI